VWLLALHSGLALALDAVGLAVQLPAGAPGTSWRIVRASEVVPHGEA
jgi:hypothetical protein